MNKNPVICAIDTSDLLVAKELISSVSHNVAMVKLGLEFFTSCGRDGVKEIIETGIPVFLDLKFHDIPNTVKKSVDAACRLGVSMLTIHASGGADMIRAAVDAAKVVEKESGQRPLILAVTLLTSMDENDLSDLNITTTPEEHVVRLATLAIENGIDGLVCSANELEALRKIYNNDILLVVPGIRLRGNEAGDDQKRILTPEEAISKGADYLVIGRPITEADDPGAVVENILNGILKV